MTISALAGAIDSAEKIGMKPGHASVAVLRGAVDAAQELGEIPVPVVRGVVGTTTKGVRVVPEQLPRRPE